MRRVKIIKDYKQYKAGEVVTVDNNDAFGLIDAGVAIITKDMTPHDYSTAKAPKKGSK